MRGRQALHSIFVCFSLPGIPEVWFRIKALSSISYGQLILLAVSIWTFGSTTYLSLFLLPGQPSSHTFHFSMFQWSSCSKPCSKCHPHSSCRHLGKRPDCSLWSRRTVHTWTQSWSWFDLGSIRSGEDPGWRACRGGFLEEWRVAAWKRTLWVRNEV